MCIYCVYLSVYIHTHVWYKDTIYIDTSSLLYHEIGKYGYWTKYKHIVTRVNLNFIYPDFFRHIWVKKSCKNVRACRRHASSRDLFFCIATAIALFC